jgi:2-methylisocitrate lyase-like PEP mutase family enzyme
MDQTTKAEAFAALHHSGQILILPNAWDAASAAIMADAGAKAVATSSAAVAWSHGFPDGDTLPLALLLGTIEAVASAAGDIPVTADIEGGYTDDLDQLTETIRAVIGAGAVGINLEDGARDAGLHARKIEAARKAADAVGVPLFINARTDIYLRGLAEGHAAYVEATHRAERYRDAGASGIFIPGPSEADLIGRLADEIKLPLNVMLVPGIPKAEQLQALGVRRISSGTAPFTAAYATVAKAVAAFLQDGDVGAFAADAPGLSWGELNKRFS